MSKRTLTPARPDPKKTQEAVQNAFTEMEHAVRPHHESMLSWVSALGAGAVVVWRGFYEALQDAPISFGERARIPMQLPRAGQQEQRIERRDGHDSQASISRVEPEKNGSAKGTDMSASDIHKAEPAAPPIVRGGTVGLVKEFIARYNDDDCPARAAALSFFGVLSLVPLLLFAVAALGFFIRDPNQAQQYVQHVISTLLPGQQASQAADQVIRQTNLVASARALMTGKWWTIVLGLLSLTYTVLGLFVSAVDPMNAAWEVKETRSFLMLRLVCLEVFAGASLFFLLSLAVSSGLWHPADAPWIVNALLSIVYEALAIALNAVMFTLVYRFLPNAQVTWRAAAYGGIVTGVLYEVVKKGFELYLSHFGNFNNKMYGALGGIVLLVTWIYYGSMLLLSGAIIGKMYHEHREEGGVRQCNAVL